MNDYADTLERELFDKYGPLIGNKDLQLALGYPSMNAFRLALSRKHVPIPVFTPSMRRGKFALVKDVAAWLAEQRQAAVSNITKEAHMS